MKYKIGRALAWFAQTGEPDEKGLYADYGSCGRDLLISGSHKWNLENT